MTRSKRASGIVLATLLAALILALLTVRDKAVIVRLNGKVDWEDQHAYDILNPFRLRAPEKAAALIMRRYQAGQCENVAHDYGVSHDSKCADEKQQPILSFSIRARNDVSATETMLLYEVKRDFGQRGIVTDPFWLRVKKQPDGTWKVIQLERWF